MKLKQILTRNSINNISKFSVKSLSPYHSSSRNVHSVADTTLRSNSTFTRSLYKNPIQSKQFWFLNRHAHSAAELNKDDEDGPMEEFLSRFVWIMRGKLTEVYSDCDKPTIDGMLLIIVGKVVSEMEKGELEHMLSNASPTPSQDFSEDLWKTVWEVSNMVLEDMAKARKKEKLKEFVQNEEVKEMYRFAGEVGVRGDMLRELRFKWAREKMEETEFYEGLQRLKEEEDAGEKEQEGEVIERAEIVGENSDVVEEPSFTLPKRHGKIKYKIYGLDLSGEKWAEMADNIHKTGEVIWPKEAKEISGKCKLVTEKILSLKVEDDPSAVLAEWKELLQPSRIDWISLLDCIKEKNTSLYFKMAELVLNEETFQTNIRDYSKLIDSHAKENRLEDAERVLNKMNENGVLPDILTYSVLVHMYSKAGNLERTIEAFKSLRSQGFQPDIKVYTSMIIAYVNAGQPRQGESLMREMEARDMKPTKEIYMALLRSFSQRGLIDGAHRISTTMHFAGFQPDLESFTLLVEAYAQAGDPDQARSHFDHLIKTGHKPDDRCTASMMVAYEKKNALDKALDLLLQLEKDGFEPGVATYAVLVEWFGKLQLVDEAEQLLGKISQQGETPPFKLHISLCEMYSKAGLEKKALQALGVIEGKSDILKADEYEKVINGLLGGGFLQDARRIHGLMEAQGFALSDKLNVALKSSQVFKSKKTLMR